MYLYPFPRGQSEASQSPIKPHAGSELKPEESILPIES